MADSLGLAPNEGTWSPDQIWKELVNDIPEELREQARKLFDLGCVGLAMIRLGIYDQNATVFIRPADGTPIAFQPQFLEGAEVYGDLETAKVVRDRKNSFNQGKWTIVAWQSNVPIHGKPGDPKQPYDEAWRTPIGETDFNFATLMDSGLWEYRNHGSAFEAQRGQCTIYHKEKLPGEKRFKYTVYIVVEQRSIPKPVVIDNPFVD